MISTSTCAKNSSLAVYLGVLCIIIESIGCVVDQDDSDLYIHQPVQSAGLAIAGCVGYSEVLDITIESIGYVIDKEDSDLHIHMFQAQV